MRAFGRLFVHKMFPPNMFYSNVPFVTYQPPVGDVTRPSSMTLRQWMDSPVDFTPAVQWQEDHQPEADFMYGPNSKSRRYKMYNRGIQATFNLPTLLSVEPTATVAQQVGRGLYPAVLKNMEAQARKETIERLRFLETRMVAGEVPEATGPRYTPLPEQIRQTLQPLLPDPPAPREAVART